MSLQGQDLFMDRIDDPFRLREEGIFQLISRCDPIACADDHRRCIKIIKGQLADVLSDVVQVRAAFAGITGQHDAACFLNRLQYLVIVEGYDASSINDPAESPYFFQNLRCIQCTVQRRTYSQDGYILAFLLNIGLSDFYLVISSGTPSGWNFTDSVQSLAFKEDNRIRTGKCTVHQALCIIRSSREDDL